MRGFVVVFSLLTLQSLAAQTVENSFDKFDSRPAETSDRWSEMLSRHQKPLSNIPEILDRKADRDGFLVTVRNNGNTTLHYSSAGPTRIQLFQETFVGNDWRCGRWDWCGTGKKRYRIPPGESVQLFVRFWEPDKRERMLGKFTDESQQEASFLILALEPDTSVQQQITK